MINFLNWKYTLFMFTLLELILVTVQIFSQGFLLTKEVFNNKSTCNDFRIPCTRNTNNGQCHLPKQFDKVIILMIDALRFDFVTYNPKIETEQPFQNKMKIFNDILINKPKQSKLYKFVADPPTTTLQRLKGLTTGSLPTFIEIFENFAGSETDEDNIIHQVGENGLKTIVLGDDTWGELFPNRFHRSFLFPSFNVMDLDTVDNGILEHLFTEMKSDWNLMIAHFLGVDHCGHRYGPLHTQMGIKLKQMNDVIKNVTETINEDTLLLVIGDHGMTQTGDHGGDSRNEIESALFLYSPGFNLPVQAVKSPVSVSQIDLVPTLASLLGVPTPFSNLGKLIDDIVDVSGTSDCSSHDLLFMNYQQVDRYLRLYQDQNEDFPNLAWQELSSLSRAINEGESHAEVEKEVVQYLTLAKVMCEEIWAKFNVLHIILGLISFMCILLSIVNILPKRRATSESVLQKFHLFFIFFLFINTIFCLKLLFSLKELNIILCFGFVCLCIVSVSVILPKGLSLLSILFVLLVSLGTFSNSFVILEDLVCGFLFLSLIVCRATMFMYRKFNFYLKSKAHRLTINLKTVDSLLIWCVLGICFCVRLSHTFLKCREEQFWCDSSNLVHTPLSSLPKEFHNARFFTSLLSLLMLIVVPYRWLQRCGNLNGWEISVMVSKMFPILCGLFIASVWALQSIPSSPINLSKVVFYLPRLVYLIVSAAIIVINYNPLLIHVLPSPTSKNILMTTEAPVIPQLFMKLKETYDQLSSKAEKAPPVVYGLATAVSAPATVLLTLIILLIFLITRDGISPGILLLIVTATLTLIFHSILVWSNANSADDLLSPDWCSVALWFLLSIHGFYSTGHQATFSNIDWISAFVGYDGTESYAIPTILVLINTFSSQLLFGMALPLLLVVPLAVGFLWPPVKSNRVQDVGHRGEFILVERSKETRESLLGMGILYISFHSFKLLMTATSAFVLRRHLMVWKIFAPHFIFESVGLMVSCIGVLASMSFILRVISSLECWSKKL